MGVSKVWVYLHTYVIHQSFKIAPTTVSFLVREKLLPCQSDVFYEKKKQKDVINTWQAIIAYK